MKAKNTMKKTTSSNEKVVFAWKEVGSQLASELL